MPQADGSLKNPNSGRCLDARHHPGTGIQLIIFDCNGSLDQKWVDQSVDADGTQGFLRDQQSFDGTTLITSTIHIPTITQTAVDASTPVGPRRGQDLRRLHGHRDVGADPHLVAVFVVVAVEPDRHHLQQLRPAHGGQELGGHVDVGG